VKLRGFINPWLLFALGVALVRLTVANSYYFTLLNIIGIHALLVVGLNLLLGYAGQISLGHAAFFGLGAYTTGILTATYGINPWLALPAGLLVAGAAAFLVGVPALKLRGYYLAMATLGFGIIVYIIFNQTQELTGGPSGLSGIPPLSLAGFPLDSPDRLFLLIWPVLGMILLLSANLVDSRLGRALRALHDGEPAAQSLGVDTARVKLLVFVWSALYASLAGSLYAHTLNFIAPTSFGFMFSIKLVTMVVVGGMASIWGSLLGAAVLTVLPEFLVVFHDYEIIIFGGILMVVMIFLPRGLVRGILDLWEFRRYKKMGGDFLFPDLILALHEVTLAFGGLTAVQNVSFGVPRGVVKAIIGPNGAGKTTLFNLITGFLSPDQGHIIYRGEPIQGQPAHAVAAKGIARTFQLVQLFDHLTVLENVMVGRHRLTRAGLFGGMLRFPSMRREEAAIKAKAWEALEFAGLADRAHQPAAVLPLGLKRLLEIARALASEPRLLLLDEPASGLDQIETDRLGEMILSLRDQGLTILLVEHDMSLTMEVAEEIVVLNYGELLAEGPPRAIQKHPEVIAAYLGSDWQG
jgi:branched-chain amino acid transport system permease protein